MAGRRPGPVRMRRPPVRVASGPAHAPPSRVLDGPRRPAWPSDSLLREPVTQGEFPVADLAFLALIVVCFALLVALVRGAEKL